MINDTIALAEHLKIASLKFGHVTKIDIDAQSALLVIRRDNPPNPDKPYMTTRCAWHWGSNGEMLSAGFYWSHYDLTREQAV